MKVEIYGSSDEFIVVEGGTISEEVGASDGVKCLVFSDGTVVRVEYNDAGCAGSWKIRKVKGGTAKYKHKPAPDERSKGYTDIVTLEGKFEWVDCWDEPTPSYDELKEWLEDFDWEDVADGVLSDDLEKIRNIVLGRAKE